MAPRDTLRFLCCGSVDDGKSTLIGRLMHECGAIRDDERLTLAANSRRHGTVAEGLDFSLLLDGLQAEREQKITIDVAYRYFATPRRSFIVADAPGHPQYTRNMATAASTADLAVLLVDARKGILPQTCRHALIAALMGIRHMVVAVNKMDLLAWDRAAFDAIVARWRGLAERLGVTTHHCLPLSAANGDNLAIRSAAAPWYDGQPLLDYLESAEIPRPAGGGWRLPVQNVIRPHQDFRGYAGTVADGDLRPGDAVAVLPSGRTSTVARVVTMDGDLDQAESGRAVTVTLSEELDVTRGDVLCAAQDRPETNDQLVAHVVWMHEQPMLPGRHYLMRLGTATLPCRITRLKHRVEPETLEHAAANRLELNEIGLCALAADRPLVFEPYEKSRRLGGFILMDRTSGDTLACGMVAHGLRRGENVHPHTFTVDRSARAVLKGQKSRCLWFTGLSGAGKSTIANRVEQLLHAEGRHTYVLDGDNLRSGINRDLGFTAADRVENVRRAAECARLMVDAGLIVLVALISPFRDDRDMARRLFEDGDFVEVFVDTPLALCEGRDPKGLYRKSRAGKLPNFTGIDSPYEAPERPEISIDGAALSVDEAAQLIVAWLKD